MTAKKTSKTAKPTKTTKAKDACANDTMPEFGPPGAVLGFTDEEWIAREAENAMTPETVAVEKAAPKSKAKKREPKKSTREELAGESLTSLAAVCNDYLASLIGRGKSAGTARSYAADVAVLLKAFGRETEIATITVADVATFFDSDAVTKRRDGRLKERVSIEKIRRITRQVFQYAEAIAVINVAPLPPKTQGAA